jgi:hypothetical protein
MVISFSIGTRCAVMLPRKFVNQQVTPATGLIINRLVDSTSLVLVEEVWQFKGLETDPLEDKCFPSTGRIKSEKWGWLEVPSFMEQEEYLILPVQPTSMMEPHPFTLEAMIKKSIEDFTHLNKYLT